eukprot:390860-Rhodomonas_salina.1
MSWTLKVSGCLRPRVPCSALSDTQHPHACFSQVLPVLESSVPDEAKLKHTWAQVLSPLPLSLSPSLPSSLLFSLSLSLALALSLPPQDVPRSSSLSHPHL